MHRQNYYYKQNVGEADLDTLQWNIEAGIGRLISDIFQNQVICKRILPEQSTPADLIIHIPANSGYTKETDILTQIVPIRWDSTLDIDCSVDRNSLSTIPIAGNKRYISVFAKFERNQYDQRVDGNGQIVYFEQAESYEIEVWSGVEAPSPSKVVIPNYSYVLLCDILLDENVGTSGITEPTDWENPGDNEIDITRVNFIDAIQGFQRNQAYGFCGLDSNAKIYIDQIPDAILGAVIYQGTWDASSASPPTATPEKGHYWVVSTPGITNLDGITDWQTQDWAIYNGTVWEKVDNTQRAITHTELLNKNSETDIKHVTDSQKDGLDNTVNTLSTTNPVSDNKYVRDTSIINALIFG